jgi:hypothetical protein
MTKYEKVMQNLRESLAHATPEEEAQPSYCMVRRDELEALILVAEKTDGFLCAVDTAKAMYGLAFSIGELENCADE